MLREMRPSELARWFEFYSIDPWGTQRADAVGGMIAATIANVHRDPKERPEPYLPADFMLFAEPEPLGDDELETRIAAAFDARIHRQELP